MCSVTQSCLILCDTMDCNTPGSSVYGILQQEYWNRVPGNLPHPETEPASLLSSELAGGFFTTSTTPETP